MDRRTLSILPGLVNRHGLVAGATGTGKTVTLRMAVRARVTGAVFAGQLGAVGSSLGLTESSGRRDTVARAMGSTVGGS